MKQIIVFFIIWLVLAAMGLGIGLLVFNSNELQQFISKGKPIYGKVTAKEPDNHATIQYSYIVDGRQYMGAGKAGRGNPQFDQIQIGQQIVVFYDSEAPENSILGYPQNYSKANYLGILFSTIFFPIIPTILIYILNEYVYKKSHKIKNDH